MYLHFVFLNDVFLIVKNFLRIHPKYFSYVDSDMQFFLYASEYNVKVPQPQKNYILFFLWFFIRLGLLYIILKVGQHCSIGKFQISKLNIFDLQVIFHYVLKH